MSEDEHAAELEVESNMFQVLIIFKKHQEGLEPMAARARHCGAPPEQDRLRQGPRLYMICISYILDTRKSKAHDRLHPLRDHRESQAAWQQGEADGEVLPCAEGQRDA